MTTIYIIRHAEAEGNLYRRIQGNYNSLITDNGWKQIAALEQRFADIPVDAVYSSDLYRTCATARAIYLPKGLTLQTDPALREVHMGDWEDKTWGDVANTDGPQMLQFNRSDPAWIAPNGESLAQVGERVQGAITRIAKAHPNQTVAIFCHGTAIRQTVANFCNIKPEDWHTRSHCDNTAVTRLNFDGEAFQLVYEGDASHLDDTTSTLARQAWWRKDEKKAADMNLWFRPLDFFTESQVYLDARKEAWHTVHGANVPFDGEGFLGDAKAHAAQTPWGVACAMAGDTMVGIIQLDPQRYAADKAGYIPFCYVVPEFRIHGLGVQLIGHAVSFYRTLGRDRLRLRCASYNITAQHFYAKYGFLKIGEEEGSRVPLDILEKYIGFEK